MQTPKRKRYQKDTAPADDIITLIHLVRQNPALYNYKLQPNQRRRIDVLNGWANIAAQIGEKYTVEECRRKWKNLRDTYHQYRLRKPKLGDGLSKWRYAKDLEFLSNVYQPKLKSHRQSHGYDNSTHSHSHHSAHLHGGGSVGVSGVVHATTSHIHDDTNGIVHHSNNSITLVNDDETFILTAYEESVNDDVTTTIDHHGTHHEDHHHSMSHMELSTHDNDVEDVEIVKNEHASSLDDDDDGATGAEVDYEEVCMYEEATGNVDCETTIIGGGNSGGGTRNVVRSTSTDSSKGVFQYIDANDFCIESVTSHTHFTNHGGGGSGAGGSGVVGGNNSNSSVGSAIMSAAKLKNVTIAANTATLPISSINSNVVGTPTSLTTSVMQLQAAPITYTQSTTRDELDLFFEFLKKKMQRFPKEEITSIQVEFLNCVLRREAESANAQKSNLNVQ